MIESVGNTRDKVTFDFSLTSLELRWQKSRVKQRISAMCLRLGDPVTLNWIVDSFTWVWSTSTWSSCLSLSTAIKSFLYCTTCTTTPWHVFPPWHFLGPLKRFTSDGPGLKLGAPGLLFAFITLFKSVNLTLTDPRFSLNISFSSLRKRLFAKLFARESNAASTFCK